MERSTEQFDYLPAWLNALAIHEAERIFEMMPSTMGRKSDVIGRLQEGIIELLTREMHRNAA